MPLLRGERSLEFFNGQIVYRRQTSQGGEQYKFISLGAVAEAFRKAPIDSGWLGANVLRVGSGAHGDFAVYFQPAMRHKLQIERGTKLETLQVYLPSLVFFGIAQTFCIWAIKGNSPESTAQLFHAPLPNVFERGLICWGENTPPRAGAATITQAWTLFITSPFNGHAASGKARNHHSDVRTLLRSLARSRKKFPLNELLPLHETLDERIGRMLGGHDGH